MLHFLLKNSMSVQKCNMPALELKVYIAVQKTHGGESMINHELPGYPSIDRPWLKYYRQEVIVSSLPDGSIYDELFASCKDTPDAPALNYYGKKTTYGELLENIMLAAKAFSALGVKAGDIVTLFSLNTPETIYCI